MKRVVSKSLRKITFLLVALIMAFTVMPVTGVQQAEADTSDNDYIYFNGHYKIDDIDYYQIAGINNNTFATSQYDFLKAAMLQQIWRLDSPTRISQYTNSLWQCIDTLGPAVLWDDTNGKMESLVAASRPVYHSMAKDTSSSERKITGDKYTFYRTARGSEMIAGSMKQAENMFIDWVKSKGSVKDSYQPMFRDDTTQQPVFVTGFTTVEDSGHWRARYSMAVICSDFKITPMLPDSAHAGNYSVNVKPTNEYSNVVASNISNMTGQQIRADQRISKSTSASASSSISGSKSYGFEESISIGTGMDFKMVSASMTVSFTASQTVEQGWSKEKTLSEEETQEHSVGIDLPPYTTVMMKQRRVDAEQVSSYTCPVAVSCRVRVLRLGTEEVDKPKMECIADIASPKDLKQRAIIDGGTGDPDGINWYDLRTNDDLVKSELSTAIDHIVHTRPTGTTNASFTEATKAVSSEVSSIKPTFSLSKIRTKDKLREYQMSVGDYAYVDDIDLEGLNSLGGEYYGFNQDWGHWKIVDSEGKPTNDTSVASLEDAHGGLTRLTAKGPGTAFIKYYIDEECYDTATNPGKWKENDNTEDPLDSAIIEINVSEEQFKGKVEVSGSFTGYLGDDFTDFTGDDGLTATVMDEMGRELDRPVVWEAKELPSKGIELNGSKIKFTKEGTFHVCAVSGDERSDWIEVTATRKPVDVTFDFMDGSTPVVVNTFRDEVVTVPASPEPCLVVDGWYKDAGLTDPAYLDQPVTENVTYYAGTSLNHDINAVAATAATCCKKGIKAHYRCTGCNKLFSDAEAKNPVTLAELETGYGSHKWDAGKPTKAATTSSPGKYTYTCMHNAAHKKTEIIPVLLLTVKASGKTGIVYNWNRITRADGYDVCFARCNHNKKTIACKKVKTIKSNKTLKWTRSGLKKGIPYKGYVRAYKYVNGKKMYIAIGWEAHCVTNNGTKACSNVSSVNLTRTAVTLKKGSSYTIKGTKLHVYKKAKKPLTGHVKALRYATTDSAVATVSSGGRITAKGKGKCTVYVIAHNGFRKGISVTVK